MLAAVGAGAAPPHPLATAPPAAVGVWTCGGGGGGGGGADCFPMPCTVGTGAPGGAGAGGVLVETPAATAANLPSLVPIMLAVGVAVGRGPRSRDRVASLLKQGRSSLLLAADRRMAPSEATALSASMVLSTSPIRLSSSRGCWTSSPRASRRLTSLLPVVAVELAVELTGCKSQSWSPPPTLR